jgi:hypothetical protein
VNRPVFVGGPLDGKPVPADARNQWLAAWPPERSSVAVQTPLVVYVGRRYWSAYPIPGWELRLREDVTRPPDRGGVEAVWTTRAWAQQFDHDDIDRFLGSEWAQAIEGVLKGYEWRDREVIDHFQPKADSAARRLAELTGTL